VVPVRVEMVPSYPLLPKLTTTPFFFLLRHLWIKVSTVLHERGQVGFRHHPPAGQEQAKSILKTDARSERLNISARTANRAQAVYLRVAGQAKVDRRDTRPARLTAAASDLHGRQCHHCPGLS
jgi:hypothetical protein